MPEKDYLTGCRRRGVGIVPKWGKKQRKGSCGGLLHAASSEEKASGETGWRVGRRVKRSEGREPTVAWTFKQERRGNPYAVAGVELF